nr:immunoglobulin light chain junction region [Macaca mulatta]
DYYCGAWDSRLSVVF